MLSPDFKVVLIEPEIPGNTGSIGRTCVALDITLILIKPYGFDISEKAVRRAGLDYWKYLKLKEYSSWSEFLLIEKPLRDDLIFFENFGEKSFYQANYQNSSYLIFGKETKGIDQNILQDYKDRVYCLPMFSEKIRSLNLSNTVTAVAYQALKGAVSLDRC